MSVATKRVRKSKQSVKPEAIVNDAPKLLESFEVGDAVRQGDLYLIRIKSMPKSARPRGNRQLADGTTQGSRHVLERGEVFDCDPEAVARAVKSATKIDIDERYCGPVIRTASEPTENDLTHPEHGNIGFPADSICAVVFQRSLDAEQREMRVRD